MNLSFAIGLVVFLIGCPYGIRCLMHAGPPVVVAVSATPPAETVTATSLKVLPATAEGAAPDLKPVATPSQVKAGEVRRAQGPPCHDCHCCSVYATRIAQAHDEIDRLRDELLERDARGVHHASSRQSSNLRIV